MNITLKRSAKETLRGLTLKENAVRSMKYLASIGAESDAEALKMAEAELKVTRNALSRLSDEQRDILDMFYIHRSEDFMGKLCRKYCCSSSTVYRMQRNALRDLVMSLYGRTE